MKSYKVLNQQKFESQGYAIVPLRMDDRYDIMKWRNEQIYHLRQNKLLTKADQDKYFEEVVAALFEQDQPAQILFSYLKDSVCIGYGGLVHINWLDSNAEISFVMDTSLERDYFEFHWNNYLTLIEQVAFKELSLHKIFTYAFDFRPRLYTSLLHRNFVQEAVLEEHVRFKGKFFDVVIHAKFNNEIVLREADIEDVEATFAWANDNTVRAFAYNQEEILKNEHISWFKAKIASDQCAYYILESNNKVAGSIRFDLEENKLTAKISYLVDPKFTRKGYGTYLLEKGVTKLLSQWPDIKSVYGFVLKKNLASIKIFKKLGYEVIDENDIEFKFEKRLL